MPEPPRLVLASTSRYRRQLLGRLGVPFEAVAPACHEENPDGLPPLELARELSIRKARAVSISSGLVIGSDQVVDLDGEVLGKPGTAERAVDQLCRLAGREHRLITGVAVRDAADGRLEVDVDVHRLTMRALDRATLAAYVAHDQPLDCAGSYLLERRGIALFERIEADPDTADDTAIIGLPLQKLCRLLRRFGYDVLTAQ